MLDDLRLDVVKFTVNLQCLLAATFSAIALYIPHVKRDRLLTTELALSAVVALALEGVDAVQVVRTMTGSTNGREAVPGTIRGDYSMSNQQNIVHASDSTSNAEIELKRFFRDEEIFDYQSGAFSFIYGDGEAK
jgi:nucleoside-diphosphate kinase